MPVLNYDPEINIFIRELLLLVFFLNLCTLIISYPSGDMFHSAFTDEIAFGMEFTKYLSLGCFLTLVLLCFLMAILPCVQNTCTKIIFLILAFICLNVLHIGIQDLAHFSVVSPVISQVHMSSCFIILIYYCLAFTLFDFTSYKLYIWLAIILMIPLWVGCSLFIRNKLTYAIGIVYHSFVMTLEIQMILGGKAIEIDENDYTLAAFCVYTCVIDIFFKLCQRFGCIKSNKEED